MAGTNKLIPQPNSHEIAKDQDTWYRWFATLWKSITQKESVASGTITRSGGATVTSITTDHLVWQRAGNLVYFSYSLAADIEFTGALVQIDCLPYPIDLDFIDGTCQVVITTGAAAPVMYPGVYINGSSGGYGGVQFFPAVQASTGTYVQICGVYVVS